MNLGSSEDWRAIRTALGGYHGVETGREEEVFSTSGLFLS